MAKKTTSKPPIVGCSPESAVRHFWLSFLGSPAPSENANIGFWTEFWTPQVAEKQNLRARSLLRPKNALKWSWNENPSTIFGRRAQKPCLFELFGVLLMRFGPNVFKIAYGCDVKTLVNGGPSNSVIPIFFFWGLTEIGYFGASKLKKPFFSGFLGVKCFESGPITALLRVYLWQSWT